MEEQNKNRISKLLARQKKLKKLFRQNKINVNKYLVESEGINKSLNKIKRR